MRRRLKKCGLLVGMLGVILGAVMVIPARAADDPRLNYPYVVDQLPIQTFWRLLYDKYNGDLYEACLNFDLALPDRQGNHRGRVALNQRASSTSVVTEPVGTKTRVELTAEIVSPLTDLCQFVELEHNQQQMDMQLKRVERLAVGIGTDVDDAKTAANDAKVRSGLTGTKVDGMVRDVATLSRKLSNMPRLTSEEIWERVVRREGVTQVTAWDEFVALGKEVRALEASSGAMTSGVEATRQAVETVQESLGEVQRTLSGMSGGSGGMTEAQGAQMVEALQAMSRGDREDCPPRDPAWWTAIGISTGDDPCKRVDEGVMKRAIDSVKEWMDEAQKARAAKARAERAEDKEERAERAAKARAERAEDKAAAEAAEAEAQRKHDEMIRELRSVGEALGEKLDGLSGDVQGLGERIAEAAERVAEAVKSGGGEDDGPGQMGEFGPLDDLPGIGAVGGSMPNAGAWSQLSYCTLPVLEAGCDFPKIRIPAILGAEAWDWYPLGTCEDDLSYLQALRLVLGAVVLVGAAALAARWIYAGLGVNAPTGEKG